MLELVAEGRSNKAIGERLAITQGAVQKHVSTIFNKLGLPAGENDDRRILAVLAYVLPEPYDSPTAGGTSTAHPQGAGRRRPLR